MLTKEEIDVLKNSYNMNLNSYEDFRFMNYFKDTMGTYHHKSTSRFDAYFSKMYDTYNKHTANNYYLSEKLNELKRIYTSVDFNDIDEVKNIISKSDYSIKDMMRRFNELSSASIIDDISVNVKGWNLVSIEQFIDISEQLNKVDKLYSNIIEHDVFSPIVKKLEKIYYSLNDISHSLKGDRSDYMEKCFALKRGLHSLENYYNKPDLLNSLIKESNIFEYINEYKKIRNEITEKIFDKKTDLHYSQAHTFVNLINSVSDVERMLLERNDVDIKLMNHIHNTIKFTENNSVVNTLHVFIDFSIAIKKNNGEWGHINSKNTKENIIQNIVYRELSNKLKKSPTIAKMFVNKLKEDFDEIKQAFVAADTYLEHEAILKSKNYNLLEEINELLFEDLDDSMNAYVRDHKVYQYGISISSKKYKDLYDEESFEIIKLLYDLKVPAAELQDSLGRKLASFKTSDDFNKSLRSLYSIHGGFNPEAVIGKAEKVGINVIKKDNNMVILKIENFEQSSAVGSSSWCIVRDRVHFNSYKEDCQQYFIYDFNKQPTDNDSIVGVTLRSDGSHSASHLKNDDQLYHTHDLFKKLQLEIIKHDTKSYPKLHHDLKSALDTESSHKKKSLFKEIKSRIFNR